MMKEINYDNLLQVGFEPCIFAPIYIGRFCYYLGVVDWGTKDFARCTMMLAIRNDGKWQDDFQHGERALMNTIDDVVNYCKENKIVMTASPSPYKRNTEN